MVTYGFYNSVDHDRTYDATQVSELFDGLINPGVYNSIGQRFKVEAVSNSFQVSVGTGRAWFNHTWTKNDAPLVLNLPAPPTMADRYRSDAIVIDINSDIKVRENKITYVCGEESANSNPPHPTLASGTHTQIPLAYIRRGAENAVETSIDPSQVNYVVGTVPECPWVVGVLQTADISVYVQRWEDAWNTWFTGKQQSVTDDINAVHAARTNAETSINADKAAAEDSINTDKAAFKAFVTEQVSEFTIWMSDKKDSFDTWFANLQYILDGDVAGHLQNEIDVLNNRIVPITNGGTGNNHGHIQSGHIKTSVTLGEFATAEGMNVLASGKCAHAEGGGDYSADIHEARFECDNFIDKTVNEEPTPIYESAQDTGHSSTIPANFVYIESLSNPENYIKSAYMAYVLKNETSGKIIRKDIGCIGQDSMDKLHYIGNISQIGQEVKFATTVSHPNYIDYGIFDYDFNVESDCYTYYGGIKTEDVLPSTVDAYIDLDYTGIERGTNVEATIVGNAVKVGTNNSLVPRSAWIVDLETNKIIQAKQNYLGTWGKHIAETSVQNFYDIDLVLSGSINSDYSYNLTYSNVYIGHRSLRLYLSNAPLLDVPENISPILIRSLITYAIREYGNSSLVFSHGDIMLTGRTPGNVYSISTYFSASVDDGISYPIVWVPAGYSIVGGQYTTEASGDYSHAEGYQTIASGDYSHAEGYANSNKIRSKWPAASGDYSHTEGFNCSASDIAAHAEGDTTIASGRNSHSEGNETIASGSNSHASGSFSEAIGDNSFAGGYSTKAVNNSQFVFGYDAKAWSGSDVDTKRLCTSIFGFGPYPRSITRDIDETTGLETIDEIKELVNKNGSGFSLLLYCPQSLSALSCRTLMPNDSFATYLEFVDVVGGEPTNTLLSYSGRILKTTPTGIFEVSKLYDVHTGEGGSAINTVTFSTAIVTVNGVSYTYPTITVKNSIAASSSNDTNKVYIKYTLMRLI